MRVDARDPKRKVALKIENKRRFAGHEDWAVRLPCSWPSEIELSWRQFCPSRDGLEGEVVLSPMVKEDEPDAKKEKDAIPLRKYEASPMLPLNG